MNENQNNQNVQDVQDNQTAEIMPVAAGASADKYAITDNKTKPVYCTIDNSTFRGKQQVYHMTMHPDHTLSEYINRTIRVKDIYIDVNQRTIKDGANAGLVEDKPRTILVDENGESYIAGVSVGVYQAVREIIRNFGDPRTWDEPLPIKVVQISTPRGNMLSLDIDFE